MKITMTVDELEQALFAAFPREDAEKWDQPGLSVGRRALQVRRVAVSLDQSSAAVEAAHEAGCNVLVTHHPAFIGQGPKEFGPATQRNTPGPGRMIYEAARLDVSVIAMHTNVDRAIAVREHFADMLDCCCEGNFEHLIEPLLEAQAKGFGALLRPHWSGLSNLEALASRCAQAFGGMPRVWGDAHTLVKKIAFLNGSWTDRAVFETCIACDIDCVVVGETKYHMCVDVQPWLAVIELGHDKSELPIVDVLVDTIADLGICGDAIVRLSCADNNWWTPTAESSTISV